MTWSVGEKGIRNCSDSLAAEIKVICQLVERVLVTAMMAKLTYCAKGDMIGGL